MLLLIAHNNQSKQTRYSPVSMPFQFVIGPCSLFLTSGWLRSKTPYLANNSAITASDAREVWK